MRDLEKLLLTGFKNTPNQQNSLSIIIPNPRLKKFLIVLTSPNNPDLRVPCSNTSIHDCNTTYSLTIALTRAKILQSNRKNMKECQCGGIIGKMCRENTRGECWLLWSVRDGSLYDGGENDFEIAQKFGKTAGINSASGHLSAIRDFHSFEGCQKTSEAIEAVKANIQKIRNIPD